MVTLKFIGTQKKNAQMANKKIDLNEGLSEDVLKAKGSGRLVHHGSRQPIVPEEAQPSSDGCIAGASGFYVTKSYRNAKYYGDWVTHYTLPTKAKIYPEIDDFPELRRMRRTNQYVNEKDDGYYTHVDELKDYYKEEDMHEENAGDVSAHLASKGYQGHMDSLNGPEEMSYYDPSKLKLIGSTSPKGEFFNANETRKIIKKMYKDRRRRQNSG